MPQDIFLLSLTAASIAFLHTLLGPDHYLPFIVMSKSGQWSLRKTMGITLLCGLGHIAGSVALGLAGVALGLGISRLTAIEDARGNIAAWALIAFGLAYAVWGLRQAASNRPHSHPHAHADGRRHDHVHIHQKEHSHIGGDRKQTTAWALFLIFVLGPCEPLIPLLMYPAAQSSLSGLLLVTLIFGAVTLSTMLAIVLISVRGLARLPLSTPIRYSHALAGFAVFFSGLAIQFLGL